MNNLDKLFELASQEEIVIHYTTYIAGDLEGLYINKHGIKIISLLSNLKQNSKKLTSILAEELGHHFTSLGYYVSSYNDYYTKIIIDKCENKALKWACEFLITEEDIINIINSGITCVYEMADILNVDITFFQKRLEFLSLKKQSLQLGNNKYLILTNLPYFYIFDPIS
ncbi:hypothetical protein V3Q09_14975 [Clostridioides difficile]|uniref:ImmA/IrrE family metallo-endopeptidase n=1 Tax=Clostridioides difficile TaxID=1496 RepID=UPI001FAC1806|nr:hypothetical protein [Clostridioides difficile]MDB0348775.1 hypothetical protein [Clostridioides difficile]MDB0467835.1 hypothetical protein [Clostridioides difficile]HDF2648787.1 hypothetical protein [Clostridioides difficile]